MQCEDFPCCGHEYGCCPDFKDGKQINMICTCGAVLPIDNPVSICNACLQASDDPYDDYERYSREAEDEYDEDQEFAEREDYPDDIYDESDFWDDVDLMY